MAKLHFKYGAMNAGKSTILLQTAHNYEERNQTVLLIKPKVDTKGNDEIVSRLGISRKVDILLDSKTKLLGKELKKKILSYDCIIVDECQFLEPKQVEELWIITKQYDIPVICYGLKTNFQTKFFKGSLRLMELADELLEMPTICDCGKKARFNARKINGEYTLLGATVEIDNQSNVEYRALCGKCMQDLVMKKKQ